MTIEEAEAEVQKQREEEIYRFDDELSKLQQPDDIFICPNCGWGKNKGEQGMERIFAHHFICKHCLYDGYLEPEQLKAELQKAHGSPITDSHRVKNLLPMFRDYVKDTANNKVIPTGFKLFDGAIGGGLYPKFYAVGAISSLGKTTLIMQMADNIARHDTDVMVFSLEMAKEDIIAKSISRQSYIIAQFKDSLHATAYAATELDVQTPARYDSFLPEKKEVLEKAFTQYEKQVGQHLLIYEGKRTAREIYMLVKDYIRIYNRVPVVIVDYLQIITPQEKMIRATDKQQVDNSVDVLAAIRRDLKAPVICISSFNRSSYDNEADNTSFKESGNIEYTADATITLELVREKITYKTKKGEEKERLETVKEAMRHSCRKILLTFQKNRGNQVGQEIHLDYYPKYNYFEEEQPIKITSRGK